MSVLYLTEAEVARLLDLRSVIDAVHESFRQLAAGAATNVPRTRAIGKGVVLHTMSGAADYLGLVGWKCYTTTRQGAKFLAGLYDSSSGELVALIEANRLGQLRTGATTAVAVEWLAAPTAAEVGLVGAGYQAQTQLAAVAAARPIRRAFVYSRSEEKRDAFAEQMSNELKIEVVPVDRPREAVEDLPIVVTATTSKTPVLDGADLAEGTLVCAMGSNWLSRAELDAATLRRADNVVCDSIAACQHEAGDFVDALEKGIFRWDRAVELADVVAGRAVGRSRSESVVVFKSVGMGIEDVATGALLVQRAKAQGLGTMLPI
ncbi:MAG TPA: ornithine cyclodeaminase family protein [Pirellulales bacterium]|nr:ornithine cyclodeaminase family protein [Pirellulales bacterium]